MWAKYVRTHLADGAVVFGDLGGLHDQIPAHYLGIKRYCFVQVRHGNANVGEVSWVHLAHRFAS
mgnify:CR=1 FL=1